MSVRISKGRDVSFDIMKTVAIFLVVLGHCLQSLYPEKGCFIGKPLFLYIYSFHMSLFMMISGYFSVKALNGKFRSMIIQKTRQLLWPAVTVGGAILMFDILIAAVTHNSISLIGELNTFVFDLWFIKSLFLLFVISWCFMFIVNAFSRGGFMVAIVFAFIITHIVNVYAVSVFLPCFLLGYIMRKAKLFEKDFKSLVVILCLLLGVYFFLLQWWNYDYGEYEFFNVRRIAQIDKPMLLGLRAEAFRIIIGMAGGLSVMIIIKLITPLLIRLKVSFWMQRYGMETLGIYCLQSIVLERLMKAFTDFSSVPIDVFSVIIAPMISLFVVWNCYLLTRWIQSHKIINHIVFGQK